MASTSRARLSLGGIWRAIWEYVGAGKAPRSTPIADLDGLRRFLDSRSSYVAQTSLYGYLRTRAGMRYPELFANDEFVRSINLAKWHVWLACLGDLAVYAGGLLASNSSAPASRVGQLVAEVVESILSATGVPADAGPEFAAHAQRVRARLAACDWAAVEDDHTAFAESPSALVRWAPIVDQLKDLDEPIVRNSVRFRWQEVRRDLRAALYAEEVMASALRSPA
jgi:hypothetical protein